MKDAAEVQMDLERHVAEILVTSWTSAEHLEVLFSSLRPLLRYNYHDIFLAPSLLPKRLQQFLHMNFVPKFLSRHPEPP